MSSDRGCKLVSGRSNRGDVERDEKVNRTCSDSGLGYQIAP